VTGSTLEAEAYDRPLAYQVQARAASILATDISDDSRPVVVCSDLWYLNQPLFCTGPVISIGPPESNAFAAHLADKLPSRRVVDRQWIIQADPGFDPPWVSCWGCTPENGARAVHSFVTDVLMAFVGKITS
jgi:hypothetical protein